MPAEDLIARLRDALEAAGIPYMVTGSFVSAVHGIPRAMHDIDVVIATTAQQLQTLIRTRPQPNFCCDNIPREASY